MSKLVAFRDKDKSFVRTLLVEKLINPIDLDQLLHQLPRITSELIAKKEWIDGVLRDIRFGT